MEVTESQYQAFIAMLTAWTKATGVALTDDDDRPALVDVSSHLNGSYDGLRWSWPCPNCENATVWSDTVCNACQKLWRDAEFVRECGKPAIVWSGSYLCAEHRGHGAITFSYFDPPTREQIEKETCKKQLREDGTC